MLRYGQIASRVLILLALVASSALAQRPGIEARRLANGLLVLVIRNTAATKVEVSAGVFVGSREGYFAFTR